MIDIPFNIWDDYWDDGYVPAGQVQETHGYIEEYDELTEKQKIPIIKLIYDYIKTLDMPGVKVEIAGTDINFTHLTHEDRHRLLMCLDSSGLKYNNIPIHFYSES